MHPTAAERGLERRLAIRLGSAPAAAAGARGRRGVLDMAHQGGEAELPSDRMYAFRTGDDRLVVLHDWTVARTTNGRAGDGRR